MTTTTSRRPNLVWSIVSVVTLWLLLDRVATWLGSTRGEYGIVVCFIVLGAAIMFEQLIARTTLLQSVRALGLRRPAPTSLIAALALCLALLAFYPVYCAVFGIAFAIRADLPQLLPGLFAQGGIAEEVIFRGILFGSFRAAYRFWPATLWSSIPFVLVHLPLYLGTDPAIATAAILLALSISFPLAWLFEQSGGSIWPGATVHFVIQGSIKLVVVPDPDFQPMAIAWIVLSGTLPWVLFVYRRQPEGQPSPHGS